MPRSLPVKSEYKAPPTFPIKSTRANWKLPYHKPSDDLAQPINWPATGHYAALMTDLARAIADNPQAPTWLPGDFFGETFGRNR